MLSNSGKNSVSEATEVSEADQKEAERLKAAGNDHLTAGRCPLAIECYSKAIKLDARNPVYFSNRYIILSASCIDWFRAAAYTKAGQYEEAIADCQEAIKIDPAYAKAYGRLGAAYAGQKKNKQAIEAYKQALELDPSNAATKSSLEALLRGGSSPASPTTAGANMKMPGNMDLGSLLNNPELMSMAQQMMSNGAMDKMMKDPSMMKMMQSMMGGVAPPPADEED